MSKATLLYKILNDCSVPNLKELLMRRNSLQTNYDLRNSHTDLNRGANFLYSGAKLWNNLPREAKPRSAINLPFQTTIDLTIRLGHCTNLIFFINLL